MYKNKLIFKTTLNDKIYYLKDTILVEFNTKRNGISTSQLNGGVNNNYQYVFNHHLSQREIDYLEKHDIADYLIDLCVNLKIDSDLTTSLITLANMENVSIISEKFRDLEVTAITTAGVRTNASTAGDPSSYYESNGKFYFGTINTIILINANLSNNVLAEAFITSVEAKTVALNNLKIPSQYSNEYATGTGTDGLCIFSNLESENIITNAGKHSKLGELIGKAVIKSIITAIRKQVWITNNSQSNVLVRLNRYSLDINDFYDNLDEDKFEFIKKLKIDSKNQKNVAITSSVLNLIDEVSHNLINKKEAYNLALDILNSSDSKVIKKLLNYWINYFLG